ncbi:hypothetical protein FDP41_012390 [Naegleria fowleri]|uniref:Uncharacterized protein n=1 Tax=Naegleria fowleri TaxID=5763 RepID=A0A6A5BUH1_NAEFO|nr:uncharacterized protein FDP41_012390 [Naegleria fowleri]KAF0981733.1 hypothetical protein FDP41_012390 [Naegleria fowleri]
MLPGTSEVPTKPHQRIIPSLHELLHGGTDNHHDENNMPLNRNDAEQQPLSKAQKSQEQDLPSMFAHGSNYYSTTPTFSTTSGMLGRPWYHDEIKVGQTTTFNHHQVPIRNHTSNHMDLHYQQPPPPPPQMKSLSAPTTASTHDDRTSMPGISPVTHRENQKSIYSATPMATTTTTLQHSSSSSTSMRQPPTTTLQHAQQPSSSSTPHDVDNEPLRRRIEELERELQHQAKTIMNLERENSELRRELQHVLSTARSSNTPTSSNNNNNPTTTAKGSTCSISPPLLPPPLLASTTHSRSIPPTPPPLYRYETSSSPYSRQTQTSVSNMLDQQQHAFPSMKHVQQQEPYNSEDQTQKKVPHEASQTSNIHNVNVVDPSKHALHPVLSQHHQEDSHIDHYIHYSSSSLHDRYHRTSQEPSSSFLTPPYYSNNEYYSSLIRTPTFNNSRHLTQEEMHAPATTTSPFQASMMSSQPKVQQHLKRPLHDPPIPTFSTPPTTFARSSKTHSSSSSLHASTTHLSSSKKRKITKTPQEAKPGPRTISIVDESSDRENQVSDLELFKVKWKGEEYVLVNAFKNRTQILNYYVPAYQSQYPDRPCKIVLSNEDYKQLSIENPSNVEKKKHAWRVSVFTIDFYNFVKNLQKSPSSSVNNNKVNANMASSSSTTTSNIL